MPVKVDSDEVAAVRQSLADLRAVATEKPDITEFYSQPARFTEPGNHAAALASLPPDPAALTSQRH